MIAGVPYCSAKRELATNTALQKRDGCDGGNGEVSARGGCYGEVSETNDIASRDDEDCLGPISEVAKKKKCQVEASSRVNLASDGVDRASCSPGEYLCTSGWDARWVSFQYQDEVKLELTSTSSLSVVAIAVGMLGACALVELVNSSTDRLTASTILNQDRCKTAATFRLRARPCSFHVSLT